MTRASFPSFHRAAGPTALARMACAVAFLAAPIPGFSTPAAAQSVTGYGETDAGCGPSQASTPIPVEQVVLMSHGDCPAPRVGGMASINDGTASDMLEPGHWYASSYARSDFYGTPDGSGSAGGRFSITYRVTDVRFSNVANPGGGGFVQASMNFLYRGYFDTQGLSNCSASYPMAQSYFLVEPPLNTSALSGNLMREGANPPRTEGLFEGYPNDLSWVAATTQTASTDLDLARTLTVVLYDASRVSYCDLPPPGIGVGEGVVEIALPCGAPVFNLPAGYTANSGQLGIVDNIRTNCTLEPTLFVASDALDNVNLDWTGGSAPFTVRRAEDPRFTVNSTILVRERVVNAFDDPVLGDGKVYYYTVD